MTGDEGMSMNVCWSRKADEGLWWSWGWSAGGRSGTSRLPSVLISSDSDRGLVIKERWSMTMVELGVVSSQKDKGIGILPVICFLCIPIANKSFKFYSIILHCILNMWQGYTTIQINMGHTHTPALLPKPRLGILASKSRLLEVTILVVFILFLFPWKPYIATR